MVSSGIYRYVASRDDLLTQLIVDSYCSLAAAVHTAHDAVDLADLDGRWVAIGLALRHWALDQPHDFALIYGSPVPDYEAPAERTVKAGTDVLALLLRLLQDADTHYRLVPLSPSPEANRAVGPMLSEPFFAEVTIGATMLARGLAAWTLLLGAVTSEVFAQLGPVPDAAALFRLHLDVAKSLILLPAQPSTGLSTAVFTA
ncbi:MAG: TetR-like C-terminal domain-containing protein [Terracoccus sp.]